MARPRKTEQLTPDKIMKAMPGTRGILSRLADRLQVARSTVYDYFERYPELVKAWEIEKNRVDDLIEETLIDEALGGWKSNPNKKEELIYHSPNTAALIFVGKTRLRHRGYSEKIDIEHSLAPEIVALLPQLQAAAKAAGYDLLDLIQSNIEALKGNGE